MNINKTARLTGLLYFIQMPLAIFGVLYVPMAMIVSGDALATVNNIASSASVFRMSIGAALLVQVSHLMIVSLVVAASLHRRHLCPPTQHRHHRNPGFLEIIFPSGCWCVA